MRLFPLCGNPQHVRKAALPIIILAIFLLASCSERTVSDSRIAMGTLVSVVLPEKDADHMDDIFSLIYEIDREISRYNPDSFISRINSSAGIAPVSVPEDIYALIKASFDMAYATDGVFNPAVGPLSSLWGFGTEDARVPSDDEIEEVLPLLDYRLAVLSDEERSVFLPIAGMSLDLGGVGKGYAADKVRDLLVSLGVDHALVNLGGNVLAFGEKNGNEPWRIGIRKPDDASSSFARVRVSDMTVITSGGYQRYVEEDGVRYHHILDSSTGYPFRSDLASATVISRSGTLGDMLSTVLFAEGAEKAAETAAASGVSFILLTDDGSVIRSDSLDCEIAVVEE